MIQPETFENTVQFGMIRGSGSESLLRLMNGVFAPNATLSDDWPESIKNNYLGHMHRFLTTLTGKASSNAGNHRCSHVRR